MPSSAWITHRLVLCARSKDHSDQMESSNDVFLLFFRAIDTRITCDINGGPTIIPPSGNHKSRQSSLTHHTQTNRRSLTCKKKLSPQLLSISISVGSTTDPIGILLLLFVEQEIRKEIDSSQNTSQESTISDGSPVYWERDCNREMGGRETRTRGGAAIGIRD